MILAQFLAQSITRVLFNWGMVDVQLRMFSSSCGYDSLGAQGTLRIFFPTEGSLWKQTRKGTVDLEEFADENLFGNSEAAEHDF